MQREGEDEVWRSIVENFGDRADIDDPPEAPAPAPTAPEPWSEPEELTPVDLDDEDTYLPPPPPPLPVPEPDRGIAWLGVVGSPLLLLVALVTGLDLPDWAGYLMVVWFVGGFGYLVAKMPKEPRDPWDDGSRV